MAGPKTLLLTIGTGTAGQLETSVFAPLRKSIELGTWSRIVLLPSQQTENAAIEFRDSHPQHPVVVRPLRRPGDEQDVDSCFEQFERQMARLLEEGIGAEEVTADFTRGTKAMSAALALAAVVHGVRTLRYITSSQRDERGMVVAGSEAPNDFRTAKVTLRRDLERALHLLRAGQFAAAEQISQIAPAGPLGADFRWAAWAARFWGAWDRFDYGAAQGLLEAPGLPRRPAWVQEFWPEKPSENLLTRLKPRFPSVPQKCVAPGRDLAADILANARRRLTERQTEEVLVRAYRVVELIGQYRLFSRGFDSGDLRLPNDIRTKLEAGGIALRPSHDGRIQIGREAVAKLLDVLGDVRAPELLDLKWMGNLSVGARNKSLLIHGFRVRTRKDNLEDVKELLLKVEDFYLAEEDKNSVRLAAARFPFFAA